MLKHHLRAVAGFEADLVDVLDLGEPVGNERVAQAVVFPSEFRSRAEVLEALLVRPLERADRARLLHEWGKPAGAILGNRHGAPAGGLGLRGFDFDEVFRAGQVDFGPVEPGNLGGAQSAERGDGEVGNHRFAVAPFATLLNGGKAGIEQLAEFERIEHFDFTAIVVSQLDGAHFVVVFGQVAALDGELEQGVDELAVVVLSAAADAEAANVILDLLAGDEREADVESLGEMAELLAHLPGVYLALAGFLF